MKNAILVTLKLVALASAAGAIGAALSFGPKSNRTYIAELLSEPGVIQAAASKFLKGYFQATGIDQITEERRSAAEVQLSNCMTYQASKFLNSGDPYLLARANKDSAIFLIAKFTSECGLR